MQSDACGTELRAGARPPAASSSTTQHCTAQRSAVQEPRVENALELHRGAADPTPRQPADSVFFSFFFLSVSFFSVWAALCAADRGPLAAVSRSRWPEQQRLGLASGAVELTSPTIGIWTASAPLDGSLGSLRCGSKLVRATFARASCPKSRSDPDARGLFFCDCQPWRQQPSLELAGWTTREPC